MAYASWSVVFGEQPSAAKWNILGTNDASFNDGTGIGTGAVGGASLSTSAITLGYTQITSNFTTATAGSYVDVTSLATTVTVPAGGRRVLLTAFSSAVNATNGAGFAVKMAIFEGATQLNESLHTTTTNSYSQRGIVMWVGTPTAASHTYKVAVQQDGAGTLTFTAGATAPAFILAQAI